MINLFYYIIHNKASFAFNELFFCSFLLYKNINLSGFNYRNTKTYRAMPWENMNQQIIFWYLSYRRAKMDQASLCSCADTPEPSLLAYTKYSEPL